LRTALRLAAAAAVALAVSPLLRADITGGADRQYRYGEEALSRGNNEEAERYFRQALSLDENHLPSLIKLGTVVSWTDRLPEAIAWYERALKLDPGNVEARLGLARTLSWNGQHARAIDIFEGLRRENPGNREAALGLARTLAWSGRGREAREIYLQELSDDQRDFEARNGLAASLSWDGRLDDALALYEETLTLNPGNRDAMAGRARVLYWQGRSPKAWDAVGEALGAHPGEREAVKLERTMREGMAPTFDASAGVTHDSDHNAINLQHAGWTYGPSPAASLGVSINRFEASQPSAGGRLDETMITPRVFGTWKAATDLGLSGSVGFDRVEGESTTTRLNASAGADYRLDDHWSFAGSLSRAVLAATARSLESGVVASTASLTAGFTPIARLGTRLTFQRDNFSDMNHRNLLSAYARWAIPIGRPRIGVAWSMRDLACEARGTGYFCPDAYLSNVGILDIGDRIGKRFGWSATGSLGLQRVRVNPGDGANTDTVRGYHVTAGWDIEPGLTLEAYAGRTNLALAMGSGFASTEAGVRLRWRIGAAGRDARGAGTDGKEAEGHEHDD